MYILIKTHPYYRKYPLNFTQSHQSKSSNQHCFMNISNVPRFIEFTFGE